LKKLFCIVDAGSQLSFKADELVLWPILELTITERKNIIEEANSAKVASNPPGAVVHLLAAGTLLFGLRLASGASMVRISIATSAGILCFAHLEIIHILLQFTEQVRAVGFAEASGQSADVFLVLAKENRVLILGNLIEAAIFLDILEQFLLDLRNVLQQERLCLGRVAAERQAAQKHL